MESTAGSGASSGSIGPQGQSKGSAGTEAGAACPSIQSACAGAPTFFNNGGNCVLTWAAAGQPASWCPSGSVSIMPNCNGYDVVVARGVDSATNYFYDLQSGQLVGISETGEVNSAGFLCIGGQPPMTTVGSCADAADFSRTYVCNSDGGQDDSGD